MSNYKNTKHKAVIGDSRNKNLDSESVDLVVTSPPYPMIQMWDDIFNSMNNEINVDSITNIEEAKNAFELMHLELKKVYQRMYDALKPGGMMVVNIGDATRKIGNIFKLYPNGAKTILMCEEIGFDTLPQIHWWKPTNSPTKFMGSGMYPIGAYVTLETEHILVFRKGIRNLTKEEAQERRVSAFFQHERNIWFTDIWKDILGTKQKVEGLSRERNGAYPFELPYRLINMFSIKGDIVVDPFGGTGTTTVAAIASGRSSIIFDIEESFINYSLKRISEIDIEQLNNKINNRYKEGIRITKEKLRAKDKEAKYHLENSDPVYTSQEKYIKFPYIDSIELDNKIITVKYKN